MKLFKANKDNVPELLRSIEKISKIIIQRIDSDDTQSALKDIEWLEDNFIQLLKLREKRFDSFKLLFDPSDKYRKIEYEGTDWSNIDISEINITKIHNPLSSEDIRYKKNYYSITKPDTRDVVGKYIDSMLSIWNKAFEKKNYAVQQSILYTIANWVAILEKQKDHRLDFKRVIEYFLNNLTNVNRFLLQEKESEPSLLTQFLSFNIYLNLSFDKTGSEQFDEMSFDFLFRNLHLSLRLERKDVANRFIERCIDSTYFPLTKLGRHNNLYSLIDDELQLIEKSYEERSKILKRMTDLGLYQMRYLRNQQEFDAWWKEFFDYLSSIESTVPFNREINEVISEIKEIANQVLNFNRLQITVIKVMTYAIFKDQTDILRHARTFNQPRDSNALWGNREILPEGLAEMLNYITFSYSIENELLKYWEGHHGIQTYLDTFFLILFYEYVPQRKYFEENADDIVSHFCESKLKNDSSGVSGLKTEIEHLSVKLKFHSSNETSMFHVHFEDDAKTEKTLALFSTMIKSCETVLSKIETSSAIRKETKERFLRACIDHYKKTNTLHKLFKYFGKSEVPNAENAVNPGINELFERMAFIDNWHIPYVGLIESTGSVIAERENSLGLGALRRLAPSNETANIEEHEVAETIKNSSVPNKIVIGANLHFDSILRYENDYVQVWREKEDDIVEGLYVGKLSDTLIFNSYDRVFSQKSLLIIDIANILAVEDLAINFEGAEVIEGFSCSFIDFGTEADQVAQFIRTAPDWFQRQSNQVSKQEEYLKTLVWVRIMKGVKFHVANSRSGEFFSVD